MSTTMTFRVDASFKKALEEAARVQGMTISGFVREVLSAAIADKSMADRIGHLRGRLDEPARSDPWRERIKERNWR